MELYERPKKKRKGWINPLPLNILAVKYATQVAIATTVTGLMIMLPDSIPLKVSVSASVTVIVVCEAKIGNSIMRGLLRVLGSAFGGALGMCVAAFVSLAPPICLSCSYKIYISLILIYIGIFILSYLRLVYKKYAYGYVIGSLTMMIIVAEEINLVDFHDKAGTNFAYRIAGVGLGICLGLLVSQLIFPQKASTELHLLLTTLIKDDLSSLYDEVFGIFTKKQSAIQLDKLEKGKETETFESFEKGCEEHEYYHDHEGISLQKARTLKENPALYMGNESFFEIELGCIKVAEYVDSIEHRMHKVSTKIFECFDLDKQASGELTFVHYIPRFLPEKRFKHVILGVRRLLNIAVGLVYLISRDTNNYLFDQKNVQHDLYAFISNNFSNELEKIKNCILQLHVLVALFLMTGDLRDEEKAKKCITEYQGLLDEFEKKCVSLKEQIANAGKVETEALYQLRISLSLFDQKIRSILVSIHNSKLKGVIG